MLLLLLLVFLGQSFSKFDMVDTTSKKFFIYNITSPTGTPLWGFPNCSLLDSHAKNEGFGAVVNSDLGYFDTWHHSLFYSLFMRLRFHKKRTFNTEEADLFIIPYDVSMQEGFNMSEAQSDQCQRLVPMFQCPNNAGIVGDFLKEQSTFNRNGGANHVLLSSTTAPLDTCHHMKSTICSKCLATSYYSHPPLRASLNESNTTYAKRDMSSFVSLPFPSVVHWHDKIKKLPWLVKSRGDRPILSSFVGATVVMMSPHTRIRRTIVNQCKARKNSSDCYVMHPTYINNFTKVHLQRGQMGNIYQNDNYIEDMMRLYSSSVFCFVPPGDDNTRRGIIDVLLVGCIPVLFHPLTLHAQYPFHMGESIAKDISIFIPKQFYARNSKKSKFNMIKFLRKVSDEVILQKQLKIAALAPSLQYSMPPMDRLYSLEGKATWSPPFIDALDVALDGMFTRAEKIASHEPFQLPEKYWDDDTWVKRYNKTLV